MRRKEREIKDENRINHFLSGQRIIRIGLYDSGEIYIFPVNYGYECINGEYTFYFHGAKAGRKYELAKASPDAGFEIDGEYEIQPGETACEYSAKYMSVIGNGTLSIVNGQEEKLHGLNCLMRQITGESSFEYTKEMLNSVTVFRLTVKNLSCKAKI